MTKLAHTPLFPRPPKLLPRFTIIEAEEGGILWRRITETDGSLTCTAKCPTTGALLESRGLIKPHAVKCVCGKWHRLP